MTAAEAPSRKLYISQAKVFEGIGYVPHEGQRRILKANTRFTVASCGRRFGKSENGGHKLTVRAYEAYFKRKMLEDTGKRMEYWITGPNYSDAEKEFRVVYNDLSRLEMPFDRPGTYNDPIGGQMHISLWGGKFQIHAKSAAHPESLVGEGLHGALMVEAAKIKQRVWTKFIRPTLNDFNGWADFTSTPEGKNWFYELWQAGQDPNNEAWSSFRAPAWLNPHVYPRGAAPEALEAVRARLKGRLPVNQDYLRELDRAGLRIDPEIVQLMIDLTEPMFNQEIGADFSEYVGQVFNDFDEEFHVGDFEYNPEWQTFAAVDYGYTNPNVWLLCQIDPFNERMVVLDELYQPGLSPVEFAAEIKRRGLAPDGLLGFYPDPASPGDTRVLEASLRVKGFGGTGGELKHRLDIIRQWLKPWPAHAPSPTPRLMFDRKCTNTIRDFNEYRYPDTKDEQDKNAPENPIKMHDHAPEALGRLFAGKFGTLPKQMRRSRVRSADISN